MVVSEWYHHHMAFTVRTNAELEEALSTLVDVEGTSRQEIVHRAVLERYARTVHTREVKDSASRLIDRWGDVLHRLGTE